MNVTPNARIVLAASLLAVLAALAACSSSTPPARQEAPAARPDPDRVAVVQRIRALEVEEDSALQVTPLRDPAVEGFLRDAEKAEAERRYDDAFAAIARARKLAPDAPDILQHEAEIEFLRGNTVQAEKLAYESFKKGPQLGTLCARNWQTAVEARTIFGDDEYRRTAEGKRDACKVKRPVRM